MVYQQFKLYIDNEDSSSVSYRAFNQEEKDLYPTFSICLHSQEGGIFKPKPGKDRYESAIRLHKYHEILLGYEDIDKEYNAHMRKEFEKADFDEIALDVLEDFVDITFSLIQNGTNIKITNRWKGMIIQLKSLYFTKAIKTHTSAAFPSLFILAKPN